MASRQALARLDNDLPSGLSRSTHKITVGGMVFQFNRTKKASVRSAGFRTPDDLSVSPTPLRRVLLIGSCLVSGFPEWLKDIAPGCKADYILFNNAGQLPSAPPRPIDSYDFQIVQLALRSLMPEQLYFRLPYADIAAHEAALDHAIETLGQLLDGALRWNTENGALTFVANFLTPQQSPMGRLLPRYDIRNPVHFIERLNQALCEEIARRKNVYMLDIDQIVANFGRKYFQDDILLQINHAAGLTDWDFEFDRNRLHKPRRVSEQVELRNAEILMAFWREAIAMFRTVRQSEAVKIVIVDLDDTLWRGLVVEEGSIKFETSEGWPLGFVEALLFLKKRGVLLAIASKNDEAKVMAVWNDIWGGRLFPEDFAIRKINWNPKAGNVTDILSEANLLARNALFIDDNPVERAGVEAALPGIRTLGADPYSLRRILLWSAETQVPFISDESARRTEMVQAQVERDSTRKRMSRDEFLRSLNLRVSITDIASADHAKFPRAFELINKTNQFNTTGRRWTLAEFQQAFAGGMVCHAFEVEDRYSRYGLVGVVCVDGCSVEQYVMSCRVIGLDVELAVLGKVVRRITARTASTVRGKSVDTEHNLLSRDLFERAGFSPVEGEWVLSPNARVPIPPHVAIG